MIDLCDVAAGVYRIGSPLYSYSQPVHEVTLEAFRIARTATTNAQYAPFVADGGYETPTFWTPMGWRWRMGKGVGAPAYWSDAVYNHPDQPVVGVTWYEALAYARWLAFTSGQPWRLPTEVEWEAAARAPDDEVTTGNTAESGLGRPQPADSGPLTWCGARHMLGNVWEWCSSRWGRNWQKLTYPYPYRSDDGREDLNGSYARIIRGGSYYDLISEAHPAVRGRFLPGSRASNIGFRLVQGLAPTLDSRVGFFHRGDE